MENAIRRKSLLRIAVAYGLLLAGAAHARTWERFGFSAGAGGSLNNPYIDFQNDIGNGFLFIGAGVDLFENRFSLQSDLGVSDKLFASYKSDNGWYGYHQPRHDTLYSYQTFYRTNEKGIRCCPASIIHSTTPGAR